MYKTLEIINTKLNARPNTKEVTLLKKDVELIMYHFSRLDEEAREISIYTDITKHLWDIIDDIDTYSDMAKSDDKLYRSLVEKKQKERWKLPITTDRYSLFINKEPLDG